MQTTGYCRIVHKAMGLRELWFELDCYQDVRKEVLSKLKDQEVIEIHWFRNPTHEKSEYRLANSKNISP